MLHGICNTLPFDIDMSSLTYVLTNDVNFVMGGKLKDGTTNVLNATERYPMVSKTSCMVTIVGMRSSSYFDLDLETLERT